MRARARSPLGPDAVRAIADRERGHRLRPDHRARALAQGRRVHAHLECRRRRGRRLRQCRALRGGARRGRARRAADVSIETESGVLGATVNGDGSVTIDMGAPRFAWDEIPLAEPFHDTRRDRAADRADRRAGAAFAVGGQCRQSALPVLRRRCRGPRPRAVRADARASSAVSRARQYLAGPGASAPDALKVRTWERGAGLTRACGTARLRRRRRRGAARADRAQGEGEPARRRPSDRVAGERRPYPDDRPLRARYRRHAARRSCSAGARV